MELSRKSTSIKMKSTRKSTSRKSTARILKVNMVKSAPSNIKNFISTPNKNEVFSQI